MSIKVGDKVPNINFTTMTAEDAPVGYDDLLLEKGYYFQYLNIHPNLLTQHCLALCNKSYSKSLTQLHAAVNDVFVMDAWEKPRCRW